MHEYGLTVMLVENIISQIADHPDKELIRVEVEIGEYTFMNSEQMQFCYTTIIPGTPIANSELVLHTEKGLVQCRSCDYRGPLNHLGDDIVRYVGIPTFTCQECGGMTKIIAGKDIVIKRLQLRPLTSV